MSKSRTLKVSKQTSLFIDDAGNVEAIHTDFVDGLNLGEKFVERVSDVEFDNAAQRWYAKIRQDFWPDELKEFANTEVHGDSVSLTIWGESRQEVLDREHKYVQTLLKTRILHGRKSNDNREPLAPTPT